MFPRKTFTLRFADGGTLELGPRTAVMGVLNVTPDSFSDGGRHTTPDRALAAAETMAEDGADLIDVGGESTRPGASPVSAEDELRRVLPVIETLRRRLAVRISVDTMKAAVAARALDAGADLVNDVSGLGDPEMLPLLARRQVPAVVMHMRGDPRTMQADTHYDDVVREVAGELGRRAQSAFAAGLGDDKIVIDPGVGFGKSAEGSLALLRGLAALSEVGRPILVGASRKSFIGAALGLDVGERLEASLAVAAFAAAEGAHIVRAHDVGATVRAVRTIDAIRGTERS